MTAFDLVNKVYEDLEEDQKMITPLQFGQLLVDWTDPTKMIGLYVFFVLYFRWTTLILSKSG